MPKSRRGFAPGASGEEEVAPRAKGGSIASRNGSESVIPAARRKCRRDIALRVTMKGAAADFVFMAEEAKNSFHLKHLALHNLVHERTHAVMSRGGVRENLLEFRPVGKAHA